MMNEAYNYKTTNILAKQYLQGAAKYLAP